MAGIDSILRVFEQNGADELKLAPEAAPKMIKAGAPIRMSFPPMSPDMLKMLLLPLLPEGAEAQLRDAGRMECQHTVEGGGTFHAVIQKGTLGLSATFKRAGEPAPEAALRPATLAPPPATTQAVLAAHAPVAPVHDAPPAGPSAALVSLLQRAVSARASDVHLAEGELPVARVDGRLRQLANQVPDSMESLLRGCVTASAWARLESGASVDAAITTGAGGRCRVHLFRSSNRICAALRLLPSGAPSLTELHLPVPLDDLFEAPHGLVLVCGPTGSGKSATLAALAQGLIRRGAALVSLEDPIEYPLVADGGGIVRQRQIGVDAADFPTGLRDAMREDPDVLLIGEMRDPETISLALTAAETGHLVLASLHSRSAASSIERIVDSYAPERQRQIRVQLADALRLVLSQRLLLRKSGTGRVLAAEVLRGNHTVASLIRDGKTAQLPSVLQSSRKEGMLPLERSLAELVRAGQVELAAAQAQANEPAALASYLHGG
jgi:twitching motility protein PilT